jgi:hypothetical protein
MSVGGQWYTSGALGVSSQSTPATPLALPAPDEAHPLYKEWEMFSRYLKAEDERISQDLPIVRPSSWGDTPTYATDGGTDTSAALHRLRCEVENAIMLEEYRDKRTTMGKRSHLSPSDATKQQIQAMPPMPPPRTYTIDTEAANRMSHSMATVRLGPSSTSPKASPSFSPQRRQGYFDPDEVVQSPSAPATSYDAKRSSVSSFRSSISLSPGEPWSHSFGLGMDAPPSTVCTSPEYAFSDTLHKVLSTPSLMPFHLPTGALQYSKLCRNVDVERKSSVHAHGKDKTMFESHSCDLLWSYRQDGGISLRAMYRSNDGGKARTWTIQDFPALGPSIPLTTTIGGEVSIDFPRCSFGRLDKHWTDIRYTFADSESSAIFQTLLYTNNGKDAAELLFDRQIRAILSDKHKPECRGKNLRLWRHTETHLKDSGLVNMDVLVLLFYTSSLEDKGHWVEEPHYAFEWLETPVYKKESDKLTLKFSKDPTKWTSDKLFPRRKSSQISRHGVAPTSPISRKGNDSMEIPGITRLGTKGSMASSAASIKSNRSFFDRSKASNRLGNVNSFGYSNLDIEFQNSKDRRAFLDVWKKHVRPLGDIS